MSFASSVNSLVSIPPKFPTTDERSAGYLETVFLDSAAVPQPSAATINAFTPISLPFGVWLLTGVLRFNAQTGVLSRAIATCRLNGVNQGEIILNGTTTFVILPISVIVKSGSAGIEDLLDLQLTCASTLGTWDLDNISSILKLVRIA